MNTKEEIELEIQARIEFKMNEFLTAVKNRLNFKHRQAFDMSKESQEAWKAFEELSVMLRKEINMPTPSDNMVKERKWKAKEKAVENILKTLDVHGKKEFHYKIQTIVSEIENAQNY